MHSIRVKLTAFTILAILVSILSVVIACNVTIQKENARNSVEMINLMEKSTQQSVEQSLQSIEQSVEMVANLSSDTLDSVTFLQNGPPQINRTGKQTAAQAEKLDEYMKTYSDRLQEDFASVASYTSDVVTYYYCINPEICPTQHGFFYSRIGKTGFGEREPLDASKLDPKDTKHTTWYYTPIKRGRPSWVGPYAEKSLSEMLVFSYVVPIYKAGSLIGVLGMDIPLDALTQQVSSIRVYESGFASLLDQNGRVLYHPKMRPGTLPEISGRADLNEIIQQKDSGDRLIRYTSGGERRQMSFSTLSNGMKLVIVVPEAQLTASWTRLTRIILIDAAVIIPLFALLMLLVVSVLTKPLVRLTDASQKLADGDYEVELNYKGKDEVGKLTHSFVLMRDHLKEYIADLNRRIHTNDLTGLPNMRYFFKLADKERQRLRGEGKVPYILYFNLIGVKDFNRQYSFEEGDRLICEVAQILSRHYREECRSHFGRDHFVVVTDGEALEEELQEIFAEVRGANGGNSLPIRVGIYPDDMGDVNINAACDRAKFACDQMRGGYVSQYRYFDRSMQQEILNNRYFISHLDQALEENWIRVFYQPIVRAATGKVCDEEALSRWFDPEMGVMSPGDFIPILERARLIHKLDLYVLDQILKKIEMQKEAGMPVVPHSLNLSREDFDSCDIVEEVRRRVDEAGVGRDMLRIEITESIVGSDFEFMKEQILRFQGLGFQVWMDDFGSGYSALDVLQNIHFDQIKFDMLFMERFGENEESKIILTELLEMARELGIETVVEGIETEEQVEFLKKIGGTKLQGYYYCRPIPLEDIARRYRTGTMIGYEQKEDE